jgi:hypothetical protein
MSQPITHGHRGIQWLEDFLIEMLYGDLISLTRTFVDNITNQTIK